MELIKGGVHVDERGKIVFVNGFQLDMVCRFYHIHQSDPDFIRAWQGHKHESKWFHCVKGSFLIQSIEVDHWAHPSRQIKPKSFVLKDQDCEILHIPGGHANGFKALQRDSILLVFSNMTVDQSKEDDYRFPPHYWNVKWNL